MLVVRLTSVTVCCVLPERVARLTSVTVCRVLPERVARLTLTVCCSSRQDGCHQQEKQHSQWPGRGRGRHRPALAAAAHSLPPGQVVPESPVSDQPASWPGSAGVARLRSVSRVRVQQSRRRYFDPPLVAPPDGPILSRKKPPPASSRR